MKNDELSELLTIRQAAKILNLNIETLRRWDKNGKLPAIRIGTRGDRRYQENAILKFIGKQKNEKI